MLSRLPDGWSKRPAQVHWIAQLGGYLGRTRAGPPGPTVLWRGLQRLSYLTAMYLIFRPPPRHKNVGND